MNETRSEFYNELITYLAELRKLSEGGYRCNTEIDEAIERVREYLRLGEYGSFGGDSE